jgi:phosphatidylglycerophosphate synthase
VTLRDAYFAYAVGAVWIAAAVLYVAGARGWRSERAERAGGTLLLGNGVVRWTYWMTAPVVRALVDLEVSANMLTWASLVLGLGAGVALALGEPGLACLLATCSGIGDILDGEVARYTHTGSPRGELLDAAVDRYTELAFAAGFILWVRASLPLAALGLAALQACTLVSYATAKAEALGVPPPRGLMRRHERSAYMIVAVGLASVTGALAPAIAGFAIVAVVGNVAAVQRFTRIARALR